MRLEPLGDFGPTRRANQSVCKVCVRCVCVVLCYTCVLNSHGSKGRCRSAGVFTVFTVSVFHICHCILFVFGPRPVGIDRCYKAIDFLTHAPVSAKFIRLEHWSYGFKAVLLYIS